MEFAEPVTLLHFTPLTDDFSYGRCYETSSSTGCSLPQGDHEAALPHAMNCSLPYSYVGSINSCEVYNSLSMDQTPAAYCGSQQEQMQTTQHPPATMPASMEEYGAEFSVLLRPDADISDISVRPPPVCLPRLDPLVPVSIDTTINANDASYPSLSPASTRSSSFYAESHSHSSPHSPMSVGDRKNFGGISKTYPKRSKPSTRRLMLRANSPMFPDHSTPLSSLKRQPSISSITSNRSADQASTFSFPQSTNSDPSIYSIPNACDSNLNSPSVNSVGQYSPRFEYSSPQGSISDKISAGVEVSSRSCLELEIPAKYARRISELDRKILKLQGERSKVLEKVHQTKSASSGLIADTRISDMDMWLFSEKLPEMGKAHLYIIPLGIHELDDPFFDDASKLLREVGGMYLDLQTSISVLRGICCKGVFIPAEISTCFAYIKSLLHENRNLKLSNLEGVYSIQLDADKAPLEGVLPAEFAEALAAANQVLKCAQRITLSYMSMQMELLKLRQIAAGMLDTCNATFNKLELMDREKRSQIRAVLEGNCITMASAERVWPQHYQAATQTIKIITECIHPSSQI